MKSTRTLWRTVGTISLLTTVLFAGGLVYAIQDIVNPRPAAVLEEKPPEQQQEQVEKATIDIVALGDSLSVGTGDVTGKGYVQQVREKMAVSSDKPVNVIGNYAKPGYRTEQLLAELDNPNGISYGIRQADLILLTIGGNDLFAIGQDVQQSGAEELDPDLIRERMPEPLQRLEAILTKLSAINPDARIVYVGVYNPFYDLDEMREASIYVQEWNTEAFRIVNRFPNMVLVPTIDLFQLEFQTYMYSDHFHPNEAGYIRIADRVVQALQ